MGFLSRTRLQNKFQWTKRRPDIALNSEKSSCGVKWKRRLPSFLVLVIFLVVNSFINEGRRILNFRTESFNNATIWRKHGKNVPSWEETEIWSRNQNEWAKQLYCHRSGVLQGSKNETISPKPRILLMGGNKFTNIAERNSSYIHDKEESLIINQHVFNIKEDALKPIPSECIPMTSWQTKQFPTCNIIHEFDFGSSVRRDAVHQKKRSSHQTHAMRMKILGNGGMRIAWSAVHRLSYLHHNATINPPNELRGASREQKFSKYGGEKEVKYRKEEVILKTLKWSREYTPRLFEDNRVDALVSERLTSSPYVIDIYGFCGNAAINEMASGDSMDNIAKHNLTSFEVLKLTTESAYGIADVHSIDYFQDRAYVGGEKLLESKVNGSIACNSTVVHNDLGPSNFLVGKDGKMKISDFNLSVLQYWNVTDNRQCRFYNTHPCGVHGSMASPESCKMDGLTEKIDVYGLGAVIFFALTGGQKPFSYNNFGNVELPLDIRSLLIRTLLRKKKKEVDSLTFERIRRAITNGVSPRLSSEIEKKYYEGNDTAVRVLVNTMHRAMQYRPQDRPTARSIAKELHVALEELTEAQALSQ